MAEGTLTESMQAPPSSHRLWSERREGGGVWKGMVCRDPGIHLFLSVSLCDTFEASSQGGLPHA